MMKFRYKIRIFIVFCGIIFNNTSYAEMYKWVDENGRTHYTQSPPNTEVEVKIIKPPAKVDTNSATKVLENQKKKADDLRDERLSKVEKKQKSEEALALKEKNCNQAKASYASYQRPRVNIKNEDGTYRVLPEEERQAGLGKAKKQIEEFCD